MNAPISSARISRRTVLKTGALTVGFALTAPKAILRAAAQGAAPRVLDPKKVDAFLDVHADGSVTLFSGKVDLGQGLRISLPQIVAEELGLPIDRIKLVEGDTALTPNQGRTAGSNGIQQGGVQIRQASATARQALDLFAATRLNFRPLRGRGTRPAEGGRRRHHLRRPSRRQAIRHRTRPQGAAQGPGELQTIGVTGSVAAALLTFLAKVTAAPRVHDFPQAAGDALHGWSDPPADHRRGACVRR